MAIALDAATDLGHSYATNAVITTAHTCTGTDRFLCVSVLLQTNVGGAGDYVTSVTYNGVGMTRAVVSGGTDTYKDRAYIYILVNPASGANNVVVTTTKPATPDEVYAHAVSYTGVAQSGQPDSTASTDVSSQSSPLTQTTTVAAANCWLYGAIVGDGGLTASTGTIKRVTHTAGLYSDTGDSNGPVGTGSQSLAWTFPAAPKPINSAVISFAPPAPSGPAASRRIINAT